MWGEDLVPSKHHVLSLPWQGDRAGFPFSPSCREKLDWEPLWQCQVQLSVMAGSLGPLR